MASSVAAPRVYNEEVKLSWRLPVAVIVLALSLTLLIWGFWPAPRERRVLPVEPSNLTLPTPSSLNILISPLV